MAVVWCGSGAADAWGGGHARWRRRRAWARRKLQWGGLGGLRSPGGRYHGTLQCAPLRWDVALRAGAAHNRWDVTLHEERRLAAANERAVALDEACAERGGGGRRSATGSGARREWCVKATPRPGKRRGRGRERGGQGGAGASVARARAGGEGRRARAPRALARGRRTEVMVNAHAAEPHHRRQLGREGFPAREELLALVVPVVVKEKQPGVGRLLHQVAVRLRSQPRRRGEERRRLRIIIADVMGCGRRSREVSGRGGAGDRARR